MKKCTEKIDITSESLLMQMPGYVCARGLNNNFLFGNENVAKLAGLPNTNKLEGFRDFDAPWADIADHLKKQDLDTCNGLKYKQLDPINSPNGFKILLTTKSPFLDPKGDVAAIIVMCMELNCKELGEIAFLLDRSSPFGQGQPIIIGNESYIESQAQTKLTPREAECFFYLSRGRTPKKIAQILSLSPRTVEAHINNLRFKLGCHSRDQIVEKANELQLHKFIPESLLNGRLLPSMLG